MVHSFANTMQYNHNDGGNPKGIDDCVARALAIALKRPYYDVAQALAPLTVQGGVNVRSDAFVAYMEAEGFSYVPAVARRKVAELPPNCIAHTNNHYTAIVDGTVQDTIDTRMEMVLGYWVTGKLFNIVQGGAPVNSAPMNFAQAMTMRRLYALNYLKFTELYAL